METYRTKWNTFFLYLTGLSALLLVVATVGLHLSRSRTDDGVEAQGEVTGTSISYTANSDTWYFVKWEYDGQEYRGTYYGNAWTILSRLSRGKWLHPKKGDAVTVYFHPESPNLYTVNDSKSADSFMFIACLLVLSGAAVGWHLTKPKKDTAK